MPVPKKLPNLTPTQVVELQDELLANADRLLKSALAVLDLGHVGLARSLAILGMEESGKAIAVHERCVQMAYAPEGEPFVNARLENLWARHQEKLELVHDFLTQEKYWFGTEPPDPQANRTYLGTIKAWAHRHNALKQRGFYVDVDEAGSVLSPTGVLEEKSLGQVINHVHQIGWQLRLGEHIEAKQQAEAARGIPAASETEIERMRELYSDLPGAEPDESVFDSMRQGQAGTPLKNDAYRLHLPGADANSFKNFGKPGYEAETRELLQLAEELDGQEKQ
jgi:AbiV family abortive infection protein